jgi:hypothetical protein
LCLSGVRADILLPAIYLSHGSSGCKFIIAK